MPGIARGALAVLALLLAAGPSGAQDSIQVRHLLALNVSRLAPFHRTYDIIVHHEGVDTVIGTREVMLEPSELAGAGGWLLVERRSGSVPAADSLFLAPDARPVRWSSVVGAARLAAAFIGDTLVGATTVGSAKVNLLLAGRPDLLVSGSMVELVLGLLPLDADWRDSAAVLAADVSRRVVVPVELTMLGPDEVRMDDLTSRPALVVSLRSERQSVLYWVDAESGAVLRMQQLLPPHVGSLLEYRLRRPPEPTAW